MFSLCITWRGGYHWVYIRFFYPNPWCDQAHGPCLCVLYLVAMRQGKARYRQWILCRQIVVGLIQRWVMPIPVRGKVKGRKDMIIVESSWVCIRSYQQMVGFWADYLDAPKMALSHMAPCRRFLRRRTYYALLGLRKYFVEKPWWQPNLPMRWCGAEDNDMMWNGRL